ncbi:MAG: hypothetical protein EBT93_15475 [Alphaproteobacteria bacterium]|nr:hypothetical protein [Alphaproteobacteria bacterium]
MEAAHHVPSIIKLMPLYVGIGGVALAFIMYIAMPSLPGRVAGMFRPLHQLFFNKWYVDELYDAVFVRPAVKLGRLLWTRGDQRTIDAFGPDGVSGMVGRLSAVSSRLQTGYVFHYAFAMLIGVVALILWYSRVFGG